MVLCYLFLMSVSVQFHLKYVQILFHLSLVMRKPDFCICENKDADQLRSNCAADQRLCFRYTDSTIPLLPKSEISSIQTYSVVVQPDLCRTWSETPKTGFLRTRLICVQIRCRCIEVSLQVYPQKTKCINRNNHEMSTLYEPGHEKTCDSHIRKQRHRSDGRLSVKHICAFVFAT